MTSPAQSPLRFGPWPGGLNLRDGVIAADQVGSQQLRVLINLDVTDSGVLVPRRGARRAGSAAMYTALSVSGYFQLLGSVELGDSRYAVVGVYNGGGPGISTFYYAADPLGVWQAVATVTNEPGRFSTIVQYGSRIYFVPTPGGSGTGWYRTALGSGTFTAVAAMPLGDDAFMVRERMFVIDRAASRVYYSKATDPTVWAAPDGGSFDVNPGDGQSLTAAAVANSQVYLFKRGRTYLFTFTSDPGVDGQLTLLNDQLGASSATAHENGIVLVNDRGAYRLLNNYFARLDDLVNAPEQLGYTADAADSLQVTVEGDHLVIGPATSTADPTYSHLACNLRTGAWSGRTYTSASIAPSTKSISSRELSVGSEILYGDGTRFLAAVRLSPASSRTTQVLDTDSAGAVYSPEYRLATGEADFGDYFSFKRLAWVATRAYRAPAAGDAVMTLRTYQGPDLVTVAQSVTVPVGVGYTGGAKVPLERRAYRSLVLELRKAAAALAGGGVTNPDTASDLWVRGIVGVMDARGGSSSA